MENQGYILFTEGFILIFKKWASFRTALDNSPEILTEYGDNDELEINSMLNLLISDVFNEISMSSGSVLEQNISDMLFSFYQEFFDIDLDDESEKFVAKSLIRLYEDINTNKLEYLEKLKTIDKTFNYKFYSIEFPINMNKLQEKIPDLIADELEHKMIIEKYDNIPDEEGFIEVKKKKK
jgi:hypothetical protein